MKHKPTGWVTPQDRYAVPVLFNPYTGEPRDVRDVQSDPQGQLITPPGRVYMLAATVEAPQSAQQIPAGYALVPIRMTRAMQSVVEQEDWEWADVLVAANAVTEEQYEDALSASPQPPQHMPADVAKDAARYRWLRNWKGQEYEPPFTVQHELDGILWGGDLDTAIDAAMAGQGEQR